MNFNKIALITVLVLISLKASEKSVGATINSNTNQYSLADIKLEKEIEANESWDRYIELRKEIMYYEKQYLKCNLKGKNGAKYSLLTNNVKCKSNWTIAEELLDLINRSDNEYNRALALRKEIDNYTDRTKTFS